MTSIRERLEEIRCRGKNYDFIDSKIIPVQVSDYLWLLTELDRLLKVRDVAVEAFNFIREHHPSCECMDSGGFAEEALTQIKEIEGGV